HVAVGFGSTPTQQLGKYVLEQALAALRRTSHRKDLPRSPRLGPQPLDCHLEPAFDEGALVLYGIEKKVFQESGYQWELSWCRLNQQGRASHQNAIATLLADPSRVSSQWTGVANRALH